MSAERQFLLKDGLSDGRPWYKHCIQAPELYNGYGLFNNCPLTINSKPETKATTIIGADVFPALSSAIRDQDVERANEEIVLISKHVSSVINNQYIELTVFLLARLS